MSELTPERARRLHCELQSKFNGICDVIKKAHEDMSPNSLTGAAKELVCDPTAGIISALMAGPKGVEELANLAAFALVYLAVAKQEEEFLKISEG